MKYWLGFMPIMVLAVLSPWVLAENSLVKERQERMEAIGAAMKILAPMYLKKAPYNSTHAINSAESLAKNAQIDLLQYFSYRTRTLESKAKPEIWDDWVFFEELIYSLANSARLFADSAGNGLQGSTTQFEALSKTCKTCHRHFRVKRK